MVDREKHIQGEFLKKCTKACLSDKNNKNTVKKSII